jgi:glc operon protein GlcG
MVRVTGLACALLCAGALSAGLAVISAQAQQPSAPAAVAPPQPPYGPPITLDQAKRVMAAAELEAAKNSWTIAITILDSGGNMVMFHKADNAQLSAITTSAGKARTALEFKLPSKAAPACGSWRSGTSRRCKAAT